MSITNEELASAVESFSARLTVAEAMEVCAHEAFPEVNDEATQELILRMVAAVANGYAATGDVEGTLMAMGHAMHTIAAWGMLLGSLSEVSAPVVINWDDIDPDSLPGPLSD